jgi:hypothetical protein
MRATSKAKRAAIAEAFGDVPVDSTNIDFLYSRRHLATVRDGRPRARELRYIIEFDELQQAIWKTLDRIRKRDGARIANEVAGRLVDSIRAV